MIKQYATDADRAEFARNALRDRRFHSWWTYGLRADQQWPFDRALAPLYIIRVGSVEEEQEIRVVQPQFIRAEYKILS